MLSRLSVAAMLAALVSSAGLAQDVIVFERVNVVPMDGERVLEAQTVIVRDGRIASIDDSDGADLPDGAVVIDGDGRYLLPGLAEMHAHVPPMSDARYVEEVLFLYVANGVTTARGMLGEPGHLELRDRLTRERVPEAVRATREAGVYVVPTQTLLEHWAAPSPTADELAVRPEMAYVSPETRQQWLQSKRQVAQSQGYTDEKARHLIDVRRQLVEALHDEEPGLVLLGSDAPQVFNVPGFSLHHELEAIVAAGLSPYEALRTGTVHAAEFFGAEDEFGRVAPGLAADLILVDGNPLEDIAVLREPAGVMVRGRWLDRAEIDAGLEEIAERYR